jgi:hypothetical protein
MLAQRFWTNEIDPSISKWNAKARQLYIYDFPNVSNADWSTFQPTSPTSPELYPTSPKTFPTSKFLKSYIENFHDFFEAKSPPFVGEKHQISDLLYTSNIGIQQLQHENVCFYYHPQHCNSSIGFTENFYPIPNVDLNKFHWVELQTQLEIQSDEKKFYCTLERKIYENGTLVFEKKFQEEFWRQFQ